MAGPGRGLVRSTHQQTTPNRVIQQCRRPQRSNRRMGLTLELRPATIHLEENSRRNHHQSPTRTSRPQPPHQIRDTPLEEDSRVADFSGVIPDDGDLQTQGSEPKINGQVRQIHQIIGIILPPMRVTTATQLPNKHIIGARSRRSRLRTRQLGMAGPKQR